MYPSVSRWHGRCGWVVFCIESAGNKYTLQNLIFNETIALPLMHLLCNGSSRERYSDVEVLAQMFADEDSGEEWFKAIINSMDGEVEGCQVGTFGCRSDFV